MIESIPLLKAYILLTLAIFNGESYHAAGPDYFVAACYLDGYTMAFCIDAKNDGLRNNAFPIHID